MNSEMQDIPERIAIAGAGIAGAWLYRALTDLGRTVDVYEVQDRKTACGLHPCTWGVSADFFRWIKSDCINPEVYVTNRIAWVDLEGRTIPGEVYLINKPRLIRELLDGARIHSTPIPAGCYDRVLDCTGAARAYLPPTRQPDVGARTVQMRMHIPALPDDTIQLRYGKAGYCWVFPLGNHRFHVGAGAFLKHCRDIHQMLQFAGLLDDNNQMAGYSTEQLCGCESTVRLTGPLGAPAPCCLRLSARVPGVGRGGVHWYRVAGHRRGYHARGTVRRALPRTRGRSSGIL